MLSPEVRAQLDLWSEKARRLFTELLEDAPGNVQHELLQRAVAAGHSPAEVHAFADAIRGLDDEQVYSACTLEGAALSDYTIAQLLRAEADPLFAYELKGGALDPRDEAPASPTVEMEAQVAPSRVPLVAPPRRKAGFEADSHGVGPDPVTQRMTLTRPPRPSAPATTSSSAALAEDLLTEATRALSVGWSEHDVDAPRGLSIAEAVNALADALERGVPVPCLIGPTPGQHRRFIIVMQLSTAGRTRAFQLYDPTSRELCWTNEGDLLQGRELPFDNKANRRLTRVVLPRER